MYSPILTFEGSKVRQVYEVAREMEIRVKTSIARAEEINCYNPIYLPRASMSIRPIFDPSVVKIRLKTVYAVENNGVDLSLGRSSSYDFLVCRQCKTRLPNDAIHINQSLTFPILSYPFRSACFPFRLELFMFVLESIYRVTII